MGMKSEGTTRIRIMADYFAEPVWGRHANGLPVSLGALPIPDDLKQRLRRWAKRYDSLEATDYAWPSNEERDAFNAQGRDLAREMQDAMGPSWEVVYQEA
jgi:hypothetical protein